jgi:hypothetical protein
MSDGELRFGKWLPDDEPSGGGRESRERDATGSRGDSDDTRKDISDKSGVESSESGEDIRSLARRMVESAFKSQTSQEIFLKLVRHFEKRKPSAEFGLETMREMVGCVLADGIGARMSKPQLGETGDWVADLLYNDEESRERGERLWSAISFGLGTS